MAPPRIGAIPLRLRLRNPKTLTSAAVAPPRLRIPSAPSAALETPSPLHFSSTSRPPPELAGFRELLARAEAYKRRWRHERRTAGEEDQEDGEEDVGIEEVVERFDRMIEANGDGKVDGGCLGAWDEEEVERFDFEKVFEKHRKLLEGCAKAETPSDTHKWMDRIDKFEEKYFEAVLKCRNGRKMLDELSVAKDEERPILVQKITKMVKLNEWKDCGGPDGITKDKLSKCKHGNPIFDAFCDARFLSDRKTLKSPSTKEKDEDDRRGRVGNDVDLLEKLYYFDNMVEERLASLNHHEVQHEKRNTEVGIKNLAGCRTTSQELPKSYFKHKGFDIKLIEVDRKFTKMKTGKLVKYITTVACGNYRGIIGFAKAEGPDFQSALEKAYGVCFQNLHFVGLHEDRTICHPVQGEYENTKVYLWPAPTGRGIKASRAVEVVLRLAGFMDVRSKVAGYRTPYNSVRALFNALNASQLTEDVSESMRRA